MLLHVLKDLFESRCTSISFAYNAAISACANTGDWAPALSLLMGMSGTLLLPDVVSYSGAMSACEKSGTWQAAVALYDCMMWNVVRMEAQMVQAHSWFLSSLKRFAVWSSGSCPAQDVVSYASLISACEKGGQWRFALCFLQHALASDIAPNIVLFNAATSACVPCYRLSCRLHAESSGP